VCVPDPDPDPDWVADWLVPLRLWKKCAMNCLLLDRLFTDRVVFPGFPTLNTKMHMVKQTIYLAHFFLIR